MTPMNQQYASTPGAGASGANTAPTTAPAGGPMPQTAPLTAQQIGGGPSQNTPQSFRDYENAAFQNAQRTLNPQLEEQRARFEQQMVNKGLVPGSRAYDAAYDNMMRSQNDAQNSARFGAMQFGLGAQNQGFQQGHAFNTLAEQARQANMSNDTQRFGIETGADTARYQTDVGAKTQRYLGNLNAETSRHGIDVGANTQRYLGGLNADTARFATQTGADTQRYLGGLNAETSRYGIQQGAQTAADRLGYDYNRAQMADLLAMEDQAFRNQQYNDQRSDIDFNRRNQLLSAIPGYAPNQLDVVGNMNAITGNQNMVNQNAQNPWMNLLAMGGSMAMLCSKEFKEVEGEAPIEQYLQELKEMPIYRWKYKGDQHLHIGPMAEDFNGRQFIGVIEAFGFLMAACKAMALKIEELENAHPA